MGSDLDLWHYFAEREEQIIAKRKALQEELEALREARASIENRQRDRKLRGSEDKLTIKEMVRSVLRRNPEGGTSDQVINWITQMHGTEVARTSLSPQLSRLKADGEVDLDDGNGIWQLTEKGQTVGNKLVGRFRPQSEFERRHEVLHSKHQLYDPKRRS